MNRFCWLIDSITRLINGLTQDIDGINPLINSTTRLLNVINLSMNGVTRVINVWGGPATQRSPPVLGQAPPAINYLNTVIH